MKNLNCYKQKNCRLHKHKNYLKIKLSLWGLLITMFLLTLGVCLDEKCLAEPQIISPVVASSQLIPLPEESLTGESATATPKVADPSPTPVGKTPEQERDKKKLVKDIDSYIDTIFGRKNGRIMRAVNRVECNPANKAYPKCVYHTEHEYSVGIFQINLYNAKHWIHASKVPGETMEEKVEWLKDPFNNTLVAYKIFTDSGFNPWAGYSSGRYEAHLD